MKNKYSISALFFGCLMLLSAVIFNACDQGEDLNTDQMNSSEVTLKSFGPCPAARGGELRFVGTNLDKVISVDLPSAEGITTINYVNKNEIRVTIPQEAQPGLVSLNTDDKKITSTTPIGYSEPISISAFSPASAKAGATIKIEGEYLNLIEEIIFADNVHVLKADFISQSRSAIEVKLPITARTGKIIVSNGADILSEGQQIPIWVYTEAELNVTLPTITAVTPNPLKAGQSLTITGTNFDLVEKVILPGGTEVAVTNATTSIVIEKTPVAIQEGTIKVVAKSGVEVESTKLNLVKPEITSISNTAVKNGASFTITGKNLDLVSEVAFQGATVTSENFVQPISETEIVLTLPDIAVNGIFTLKTLSLTETVGSALTFILPTVTAITPTSVKAKETIVLTGSNLDLIKKVIFGTVEGTISAQSETSVSVVVPVGAISGKLKLVTVNATEGLTSQEVTINVTLPVFTSYSESKATPGKILTINGSEMNLIKELIFPGEIKATAYGSKSDTKVEVYVPSNVVLGYGTIRMITYEGDEGLLPEIYFGGTDPVVDESLVFFDFNGTGSKDSWWGNAINSGILDDPTNSSDGTSFWNVNGNGGTGWWDGLFFRNGNNNYVTTGIDASKDVYKFDVNVRETIYEGRLQLKLGDYSYYWTPWNGNAAGFKTVGWITIEVPLTEFKDSNGNSIPDAALGGKEFGMIWSWGTSVKVNMGIDNVRFEIK